MANFITHAAKQSNFIGSTNQTTLKLWFIAKDARASSGFRIYAHYGAGSLATLSLVDAKEQLDYWQELNMHPTLVAAGMQYMKNN
jgi:hypothetical protein